MEELFHQNQTEIKKKLREKIRAQIRAFSPEEKARSDARIFRAVLSLPLYQRAKVIFVYVSLDWEIDTHALIKEALSSGKTVAVPKCLPGGRMEVYRLKDFHQLKAQMLGILEPEEGADKIAEERLELALIPCLSCTRDGIRLGQGGGYYDRFLAGKKRLFKLALCRESLLSKNLPCEAHDIRMDAVLTETAYFSRKEQS